jgi:hypothetical protein
MLTSAPTGLMPVEVDVEGGTRLKLNFLHHRHKAGRIEPISFYLLLACQA